MKFTQQRRVRLAQGLWLLSWLAVMCGTFVFCLGVYLKTELLRRAEVERTTNNHLHGEGGKTVTLTLLMQTQFHVLGSHIYSCNVSHVVAVCVNGYSQLSSGFLELSVLSVMDDDQVGEGCDLHRTAQLFKPTSHWAAQWLLIDFFLDAGWLHWYPGGLHRKAAGYKHISSDFYWCPMRAPVFHNRCVTSALSGRGEEWKAMANVFIRCAFHFKVD